MNNYTIDDYINFIFNNHPAPTSLNINTLIDILALIEKKYYELEGERMFIFFWINNAVNPLILSDNLRSKIEMIHNNNCVMHYHRIPILYKPNNVYHKEEIKKIIDRHYALTPKRWKEYCAEEFNLNL